MGRSAILPLIVLLALSLVCAERRVANDCEPPHHTLQRGDEHVPPEGGGQCRDGPVDPPEPSPSPPQQTELLDMRCAGSKYGSWSMSFTAEDVGRLIKVPGLPERAVVLRSNEPHCQHADVAFPLHCDDSNHGCVTTLSTNLQFQHALTCLVVDGRLIDACFLDYCVSDAPLPVCHAPEPGPAVQAHSDEVSYVVMFLLTVTPFLVTTAAIFSILTCLSCIGVRCTLGLTRRPDPCTHSGDAPSGDEQACLMQESPIPEKGDV